MCGAVPIGACASKPKGHNRTMALPPVRATIRRIGVSAFTIAVRTLPHHPSEEFVFSIMDQSGESSIPYPQLSLHARGIAETGRVFRINVPTRSIAGAP